MIIIRAYTCTTTTTTDAEVLPRNCEEMGLGRRKTLKQIFVWPRRRRKKKEN